MKFFSLILLLSFLTGCSYFSKKFESLTQKPIEKAAYISNNKNYCPANSKIQYISEDEYSLKFYKSLHPSLFENQNLSFIEKSLMFSLLEMSRRPDEASPYSRLQVYLKLNGKTYYYDFRPKKLEDDTKMPFLKGLDYLAQKFAPHKSLLSLATQLDTIIPQGIGVSLEFETFLKENRKDLVKNDDLMKRFFKGDEIITRFETFDRIQYKSIIEQYSKGFSNNADYEFEKNGLTANKTIKENYETNCNYDLSKETSLRDEIMSADQKNLIILL